VAHSEFVHLHVHTCYSMLDGACRIPDLMRAATARRFPALAVTDHGGMFGVIDFYQQAIAHGIKPIIGSEFYVAPRSRTDRRPGDANGDTAYHLVLLARDIAGYRNLLALSSLSYLEGFYKKPRIDRESLAAHSGGLIALSACLKGEPARKVLLGDKEGARAAAAWYRDLLGDAYYLELQSNGLPEQEKANAALVDIARDLGVALVATNDVHYLNRDDHRLHDVLLCIQTGKTVADENRMRMEAQELYLKSEEEMRASFGHLPGALSRTLEVAERCNLEIPLGRPHLPRFPLPPGESEDEVLEREARAGFEPRLAQVMPRLPAQGRKDAPGRYRERLERELAMIKRMGFSGYFLIVQDFISHARRQGIPVGPGRGSAAGSLVAYALGITDIDPIRYGLLFERFLNPERVSLPDIDVDFCQDRRDEVLAYVTAKYGADRVAQIITFGTMAARAAIRDVGRALGMPYGEVDRIAKLVPEDLYVADRDADLSSAEEQEPRLREARKDPRHAELLDLAGKVEGLLRHASTHAAGVVISPDPLVEHVPLYRGRDDEVVTQYAMHEVETVGLVKFDFLGLRTLTLLKHAVGLVDRRQEGAGGERLDLSALDLADKATYELLARGQTDGVFQLESSGMKDLLMRFRPACFEDLVALVALYRPGPLKSGMTNDFVNRKHGRAPISHDLPQIKEVLRETYGVIVYQEQVMELAVVLAGFSLGEADNLRRAMGKKDPELMERMRQRFLDGCRGRGIAAARAEKVFRDIEQFAGYGFNKSHSAAYAVLTFQTAYLKAHHPAEFMAALLTSETDKTDKVALHLGVCRDMGLRILPPDVNESDLEFTVVSGGIRFGMAAVKNVGEGAVREILDRRREGGPFRALADFCARVDGKTVNRRVIESLIKAGAFDGCCGGMRARLMAGLDRAMDAGQKAQRDLAIGQGGLFSAAGAGGGLTGEDLPEAEEWSDHSKLAFEKESLGFYVTGHPLERHRRELERYVTANLGRLGEQPEGATVRVAGMVQGVKPKTTKAGERMAFVTLEDLEGSVEVVVFPKTFKEAEAALSSGGPLVVDGTIDATGAGGLGGAGTAGGSEEEGMEKKVKVRADSIVPLSEFRKKENFAVMLHLSAVGLSRDDLASLREVLGRHRGSAPVRLRMSFPSRAEAFLRTGDDVRVDPSEAMVEEVERLLGAGAVTFE
jgi:DNA polymerase-3 subunit alpha